LTDSQIIETIRTLFTPLRVRTFRALTRATFMAACRQRPLACRNSRQRGITLLELLVVIAVIGILIAILLPAIQAAREAGRRISCQNNQKQIALALLNYHDTYETFPPNRIVNPGHNWVTLILNQMEQGTIHRIYRMDLPWSDVQNQPAISTRIKPLICPSCPSGQARRDQLTSNCYAAISDYAATGMGIEAYTANGLTPPGNLQGILAGVTGMPLAAVEDGASNTFLVMEDAGRPELWIRGRIRGPKDTSNGCSNGDALGGRVTGAGWADPLSGFAVHSFADTGLICPGPCILNCTNDNEPFSFHPGGLIASYADGSARFVSESIALRVFAAQVTRAGRESNSHE
jgi:prepilin-type N-terminal cleavage/methylation domain-containing protein